MLQFSGQLKCMVMVIIWLGKLILFKAKVFQKPTFENGLQAKFAFSALQLERSMRFSPFGTTEKFHWSAAKGQI